MQVVEISEPGGPEVLISAEREIPEPGPGEVLIRIAWAGVNRPDVMQRSGRYDPPPEASDLPGLECAGEIVAAGPEVDLSLGQRVCALLPGGGYAEYALTPAAHCLPVPAGLELREAAGLPETFFTVWSNMVTRGRLRSGESVLIHGGTSGIGTTAIQIAGALGARVFATAGSEDKCRFCRDLGAERAINYREEDFVEVLQAVGGADVILDMVGGSYIPRNLGILREDGRLVMIAFLQGPKTEINFAPLLLRRLTVTGSTLRPQSRAAKAAIAADLRETVWPMLEDGRIGPVIDSDFVLSDAANAHRRMEGGDHIGKILLKVSGE